MTSKVSTRSVDSTVERLLQLLDAKGMKLFSVIDQQAEARSVGLELRATTLVIFGNPLAGTPVMDAAPLSALDLPLKVLIWDDGGTTKVTYVTPSALAIRYDLTPALEEKLAGIEALTTALVET